MAKFAYTTPYGINGKLVDAAEQPIYSQKTFYCSTKGCCARMYLRSAQKRSATFASYPKEPHSGGYACKWKHEFHPDQYDEKMFILKNCYDYIFGSDEDTRDRAPGKEVGKAGSNRQIPVKTLKQLFQACIYYRDTGEYNRYRIDDILVDGFSPLSVLPLRGRRIIVCTFIRYDSDNETVRVKTMIQGNSHYIDLYSTDGKTYRQLRKKLYNNNKENNYFVVAGEWSSTNNCCVAQCTITSVSKQICKAT